MTPQEVVGGIINDIVEDAVNEPETKEEDPLLEEQEELDKYIASQGIKKKTLDEQLKFEQSCRG